jgi:nitrogen regulatory protein PII
MDYDLIITIVNRGFADNVVDAATEKGARGGTVLNAHGSASHVEKFFNISIQPEKELVLIVVDRALRHDIMESITTKAGLRTGCQGISFSIPVDEAIGLAPPKEE